MKSRSPATITGAVTMTVASPSSWFQFCLWLPFVDSPGFQEALWCTLQHWDKNVKRWLKQCFYFVIPHHPWHTVNFSYVLFSLFLDIACGYHLSSRSVLEEKGEACLFTAMLGIEHRDLDVLGKYPTQELHCYSQCQDYVLFYLLRDSQMRSEVRIKGSSWKMPSDMTSS